LRLLEEVASGRLDPRDALADLPRKSTGDELLDSAWHELGHFASDIDIRSRDAVYAAHQVSQLRDLAQRIRSKFGLAAV
jgi:hypothetical protein